MTYQPDMPTTDEVRDKYAEFWIEGEYFGNDDPDTRADFDRWLAKIKADAWREGYTAGVEDERIAADYNVNEPEPVVPNRTNPYRTKDNA